MRSTLALFLILLSIVSGSAQTYQSIYANRICNYTADNKIVKFIRVDSVKKIDGMNHLYLIKNVQPKLYCFTPYGASWMGNEIVTNDTWNLFFNLEGDTIHIKVAAKLNEQWTAYSRFINILARVVKHDTLTFLGLKDSVKTISFRAYDTTMNSISHPINGQTIVLSKNYGLVNTFNFLLFPYYQTVGMDEPESFQSFTLSGISNPEVGMQNLTWFQVNDFSVGDELHILSERDDFRSSISGYVSKTSEIITYLSRRDYPDSIIYKADRQTSIVTNYSSKDSTISTYLRDTILTKIFRDSLFDLLPDELVISKRQASSYYMVADTPAISKFAPPNVIINNPKLDSCWEILQVDSCFSDRTYFKGLGGPYRSCRSILPSRESKRLVYYKKGNKIWGTPLLITGVENSINSSSIQLFPNPVRDQLVVKTQGLNFPCHFELVDAQGSVQLSMDINSAETLISLDRLNTGIFLYRVSDSNNQTKSGKLLKF